MRKNTNQNDSEYRHFSRSDFNEETEFEKSVKLANNCKKVEIIRKDQRVKKTRI